MKMFGICAHVVLSKTRTLTSICRTRKGLTNSDLLTASEKSEVHVFTENSVSRLKGNEYKMKKMSLRYIHTQTHRYREEGERERERER